MLSETFVLPMCTWIEIKHVLTVFVAGGAGRPLHFLNHGAVYSSVFVVRMSRGRREAFSCAPNNYGAFGEKERDGLCESEGSG